MQLNRQQQQEFAQRMSEELERVTMSWDNELRTWYPTAIHALSFASAVTLQVPQNKVIELHGQEAQGLNMNVVMALCNNVESRTPVEMGVTAKDWASFLQTNHAVARRWQELQAPIQKKVMKEFEAKSRIVHIN